MEDDTVECRRVDPILAPPLVVEEGGVGRRRAEGSGEDEEEGGTGEEEGLGCDDGCCTPKVTLADPPVLSESSRFPFSPQYTSRSTFGTFVGFDFIWVILVLC